MAKQWRIYKGKGRATKHLHYNPMALPRREWSWGEKPDDKEVRFSDVLIAYEHALLVGGKIVKVRNG